ncbi:hypothetical protein [Roseomonas sp. AR75]|uniref:hypothetical protein n=1 Tax=Roseomonas sp. AR75 TaxID=2562311 RepID=UPI0010C070F1|nr:hypothetical protein [Roseomonas sp. AR75]
MSLHLNLMHAEAAVAFAEKHLRGRASNKPEDIIHTHQENLRRFATGISANKEIQQEIVLDSLANSFNVRMGCQQLHGERAGAISSARDARKLAGERLNAAAIIRDGIGNCFEHAVLACHHLNGKGVASYMVDTDDETNHCFVLIGLGGGLDGTTVQAAPNALPGAPFNAAFAVVCDPWYHEWFAVGSFWATKMHRILMTTNKRATGLLPAQVPFTFTASNHVT